MRCLAGQPLSCGSVSLRPRALRPQLKRDPLGSTRGTMKPWVRDTLRSLGRYLAIFGGGLAVFMVLAPIVGYSTYGDRPPAGWHGWFPLLEWSEYPGYLLFVTEFVGILLLPWAALLFLVPLATVRYLERRAASR